MKYILSSVFVLFTFIGFSQFVDSSELESIAKSEMTHANNRTARIAVLSDSIDVIYHDINWTVNPGDGIIAGEVFTRFIVGQSNINQLFFDLSDGLTVDSVKYHGNSIPFARPGNAVLEINLTSSVLANMTDSVSVFYNGTPTDAFVTDSHGSQNAPEAWTISEPYGAREWWPCKDQLNDKIDSMDIHVTTSLGNKAGSLGLLTGIDTIGSEVTYHWKHRFPVTPYLVSIAVTNYLEFTNYVHIGQDSFPVVNYVYPESFSYAESQVNRISRFFELFDSLFIPYPFMAEKYGHCETSIGGGMEHQTMSTMGSFSDDLMAHELAHQWFGDYTTCASWEELWLNEGFATYLTGLSRERYNLPASWDDWKRGKINNITSQSDGSVFVTDTNTFWRLFDSRLTYDKGSYVLHMLRWKLGDNAFFTGVQNYLNDSKVKFGFTKNEYLITHLEATSGQDLTEFFADWFYGEGYPTYQITLAGVAPDYAVRISQTTSHPSVNFFEMPVEIRLQGSGLDTLMRFENTENNQWFDFTLNKNIAVASFDPNRWLIMRSGNVILGNQEVDEQKLNPIVFPQPAINEVNVSNLNPLWNSDETKVYSVTGALIDVPVTNTNGNWKLDLTELPIGIFFLDHPEWNKPIRFIKSL
ncbi:MAG: aminopeptidase N [Dokdonia sp.]|jgi:aminopeptidase N